MLQGCTNACNDITAPTKPVIDSKMEAMLFEKEREIELLKKESDSEVAALKSKVEVRNILMY
jgi:hypothetical protein